MSIVLGIDPGVSGAIARLGGGGKYYWVEDMPTVLANKSSNRRMVSPADLSRILRTAMLDADGDIQAITENVASMPKQGVASVFAFGKSYGILLGSLAALGIPCHIVTPGKWKKHFALGADKEQSRELAQRFWPLAPLNLKKHDGRAEALLLARFYVETMAVPAAETSAP